jgi:hypothetical protein
MILIILAKEGVWSNKNKRVRVRVRLRSNVSALG